MMNLECGLGIVRVRSESPQDTLLWCAVCFAGKAVLASDYKCLPLPLTTQKNWVVIGGLRPY